MKIRKEIKIFFVAVILVIASYPLIYWVLTSQINPPQNNGIEFSGNHEVLQDYIRLWTSTQGDSWSGMNTAQKWSFATPSLSLKAQVRITSLGSPTFYAEVILVTDESETYEGFGFQITYGSDNTIGIRGWTWIEEDESFTTHIEKDTNVDINLEAKKVGYGQIDFYVDNFLVGSILTPIPNQEGIFDLDITNGSQGGFSEIYLIKYEVQEET